MLKNTELQTPVQEETIKDFLERLSLIEDNGQSLRNGLADILHLLQSEKSTQDLKILCKVLKRDYKKLLPFLSTHEVSDLIKICIELRIIFTNEGFPEENENLLTIYRAARIRMDGLQTTFSGRHWMIVSESEYTEYNDTYIPPNISSEHPIFSAYNISMDARYCHYFKSCGIFIYEVINETTSQVNPETQHIDFTPFNATAPGEYNVFEAIALAYRGIVNYLHAIDSGEFPDSPFIYGETNWVMAQVALRFGFQIDYKKLKIEPSNLKKQKKELQSLEDIPVFALVSDLRQKIQEIEQSKAFSRIKRSLQEFQLPHTPIIDQYFQI